MSHPFAQARKQTMQRWDTLLKPPGSLGFLEEIVGRLAAITGDPLPKVRPATVVLMAADHGIVEQGVTPFPQRVTAQMVSHFFTGGTAITVLCAKHGLNLHVVDVGVAHPLEQIANHAGGEGNVSDSRVRFTSARVRNGTADFSVEPAMTRHEAEKAFALGRRIAKDEHARGTRLLITAEMGIGNSTTAAAITAALLQEDPVSTVGPGSGLAEDAIWHKAAVVQGALALHKPNPKDPLDVLAKVGGLEFAALAGLMVEAAHRKIPVLLDGYMTGAAAFIATRLEADVSSALIAAHRSAEPGHRCILKKLDLTPLLDLSLAVGEGVGAAIAFPVLESAVELLTNMKTFAQAGIGDKDAVVERGSPAAMSLVDGAYGGPSDSRVTGQIAPSLMIVGTSSDAGKSLLSAALCRIFHQDGRRVAPFKAQNMSRQTIVTRTGGEIAHAQGVQAQAAGVEPDPLMNPLLLKPVGDRRSRLLVMGEPVGETDWSSYRNRHDDNLAVIERALTRLRTSYDIIVMEGAGSPAEVNLMDKDVANMAVAELADAPVLLVVDIERGGAFASLLGTYEILPARQRRRLAGYVINKFRGDPELLTPALQWVKERTGLPCLGIVPWLRAADVVFGQSTDRTPYAFAENAEAHLDAALDELADKVRAALDMQAVYRLLQRDEGVA